jgi:predicted PurR-regulated permease PerM
VVAVDQRFGFIGLIIAVPIVATVTILADELWIKPLEQVRAPVEQLRRASAEGLTVRARR